MNQLMNDEAVYRTAPATPGLLKSETGLHNIGLLSLEIKSLEQLALLASLEHFF